MSKRRDKRARRRQQRQNLPDARRDYLIHQERRGKVQTTPREWQVREPFYLPELGLLPVNRGPGDVPRYAPGPVISTR